MSEKRRDSKGRVLRNGESQRSDGKYMFRYTDSTGERHTVYSWKLVSTDKLKEGQRNSQALRDMEKRILKDLDDSIKTRDAEHTTVDDLFEQFMDIRKDLRESSRCCYNDIYRKHIKPVMGHRPVGRVKPTEIQKLYQIMVSESGVNPTTAQKAHSIIYQLFENAVMDNVIRVNPASNAFRNFRKTAELNPACREPLIVEQQEVFIDYIYASEKYGRMANLFTVLLGTGMRIGEALGLRWCDCDFEEGIIHVTHEQMLEFLPKMQAGLFAAKHSTCADVAWHSAKRSMSSQNHAHRPVQNRTASQPQRFPGFCGVKWKGNRFYTNFYTT